MKPHWIHEKEQLRTYIDVFQVKEVEDDAVALPDDGRPQRPADATRQDGAEAHRDGGDADPLLLGQCELDHLCKGITPNSTTVPFLLHSRNNFEGF